LPLLGVALSPRTAGIARPAPIGEIRLKSDLISRLFSRGGNADGTESRLDLGGYEIRIDQPDREFHARFILGKVSVLARAVRRGS